MGGEPITPMVDVLAVLSVMALSGCPPPPEASGRPAIDPGSQQQLDRCLKALPQTRDQHRLGQQYTWARHQLHRRMLAKASAGARCVQGQQPIALFTAGPPGSGKTTWLRQNAPMLLHTVSLRIDADALRLDLPEYQGWNAYATQAETGDVVNALLRGIGQPCRVSFLYDGTMTKPDRYLPLFPRLHQLGYRIYIVEVSVPIQVSRQRALERYQTTGRYVPVAIIEEAYKRGPKTIQLLRPLVDGYVRVDGETGKILESSGAPLPR